LENGGTRISLDKATLFRFFEFAESAFAADKIEVNWLGGEPLMLRGFVDLVHDIRARFFVSTTVTTNGWLPFAGKMSKLATLDRITFSVDGPKHVHDSLRGRLGSWERILQNVRTLRACADWHGIVAVNSIITRGVTEWIATFVAELAEAGVDEITFNCLQRDDNEDFYNRYMPTMAELTEVEQAIHSLRSDWPRIRLCGNADYWQVIKDRAAHRTIAVPDCTSLSKMLFLSADGKVSICPYVLNEFGFNMSDVVTPDQFRTGLQAMWAARRAAGAPQCQDCQVNSIFGKYV
jgi:sulfatase maturation enzyme AslB (radical SAM superfamily)